MRLRTTLAALAGVAVLVGSGTPARAQAPPALRPVTDAMLQQSTRRPAWSPTARG